jgi:hypothetical protein
MWLFMQDLQQEGDAAHADPLHGRETVEMTQIVERNSARTEAVFRPVYLTGRRWRLALRVAETESPRHHFWLAGKKLMVLKYSFSRRSQ